jgi:hypothetical protein
MSERGQQSFSMALFRQAIERVVSALARMGAAPGAAR